MAWKTPDAADLLASLGADEADLLNAKSVADGADVQKQVMQRTADLVRASVRRSGVAMGPDGTIPQEALQAWADIAAADCFRRLNIELKASRIESRKEAVSWLALAAENKVQVVPYGADEQTRGGQSPKVTPRLRTFGRDQEEGI